MSSKKPTVVLKSFQGLEIMRKSFEAKESLKGDGVVKGKLWYVNTNASSHTVTSQLMNVKSGEVFKHDKVRFPDSQFTRMCDKEGWELPSPILPSTEVSKNKDEDRSDSVYASFEEMADDLENKPYLALDVKENIEAILKNKGIKLIPPSNSLIKKGILLVSNNDDCYEYFSQFTPKEMSIFMQPSMKAPNPVSINIKVVEDTPEGNGCGFLCSEDWAKVKKAFNLSEWVRVIKIAGQDDSYFVKAQLIEKPELEMSEICIDNFKAEGLNVGDVITLDQNSFGLHQTEIPSCKQGSNISTQELKFLTLRESRPYDVIRKEIIEALQMFINGDRDTVGEILNMVEDDGSEILHQLHKYWKVGVEVDHPVYNNALRRMASSLFKTKVLKLYSHESLRSKALINPNLHQGECLVPQYTFKRENDKMLIKPQYVIGIGDKIGVSRMPVLHRSGIKAMQVVGFSSYNCIEISPKDMQDMQGDADGDDLRCDKNLIGSTEDFPFVFNKEKKEKTDLITTCCDIKFAAERIGIVANAGTKELLLSNFEKIDNKKEQEMLAFLYQAFVGGLKWKLPKGTPELLTKQYPESINTLCDLISKRDMSIIERVNLANTFLTIKSTPSNPLEMFAHQLKDMHFTEPNREKYSKLLSEVSVETFGFTQSPAIRTATQSIFEYNLRITNAWNEKIVAKLANKEKPEVKKFKEILPRLKMSNPELRAKQVSMLAKLVSKRKLPSLFDTVADVKEMQIVYRTSEK